MDAYPRCEIEVGDHKLVVQLDSAISVPLAAGLRQHGRKGVELKVYLICCSKLGTQFRVGGGGRYYTLYGCPVCYREKKEEFWYDDLRPLLPAEWWQPQGRMS